MIGGGTPTERLTAFSDGVFSVIITIMVLDLKPPAQAKLSALLVLWPTALSYAVSYLFVAIIWINHQRPLLFAHDATPNLIWWNFRASVHDFTHTFFNCLDCRHKARGKPGPCLCSSICNGEYCIFGISAGGIVASEYS
jgi:hypothetical protein